MAGWLDDLQVFLKGKKTILTTVIGVVDYYGVSRGWWEESTFRTCIEGLLWGVFLRNGIQASGPQPLDMQAHVLLLMKAFEAERKRAESAMPVVK